MKMQKILVLVLALIMIVSMFAAVPAYAETTLVVGVPTLTNSLDFEEPTLSGGQIIAVEWEQ